MFIHLAVKKCALSRNSSLSRKKKHVKKWAEGQKAVRGENFCIKKMPEGNFDLGMGVWLMKKVKAYAFGVFLLKISWALCLIAVRVLSTFFFSTLNLSEISL